MLLFFDVFVYNMWFELVDDVEVDVTVVFV